MSKTYRIVILGASYGSLLGTKLSLAGHEVTLVCLSAEVEAIKRRVKDDVGEKSRLDVLIPVAQKFTELAEQGAERNAIFAALKLTAEQGMQSTRDKVATKGRAAFLGERAIGHIDAGAKSSQVMIAAVCDLAAASSA